MQKMQEKVKHPTKLFINKLDMAAEKSKYLQGL